ncbi:MAG TPA: hypothetical protein VE871_19405 [Longimicrobium sp.]|nr:hypothetical protein [Longimicrobium sp.]
MNPRFESPEIAVLYEFPGVPCRVAALAREGDDAYAVVDVGDEGEPRLHGITVLRGEGGWEAGTDGSGPGWTRTDPAHDLGTATAWGQAPEGTVRVRATLGGDTREMPVARGIYLVAWWRVPRPGAGEPRVDAFRVGDRWVPASPRR